MSPRALGIALVISVAVNLFAAVAIATGMIGGALVDRDAHHRRGGDRDRPPSMSTVDGLDPAVRETVRERLREYATTARPDFAEAREARREAITVVQAEAWDRAKAAELLAKSRAAELRGRDKLEAGALEIMSTLTPEQRAQLSPILNRRDGHRGGRGRGDRGEGRGQPPAQ